MAGGVKFRVNANGLVIEFEPDASFESICWQIGRKLEQGGYFFQTRYFAATYRGRRLSTEQERAISALMAEKTGAKTVVFEIDPTYAAQRGAVSSERASPVAEECMARFVYGPLDREQRVKYSGSVVVIGDVGPSAQVLAGCDIVVMGTLRGEAHAGCDGDESATVSSLAFATPRLRIAGYAAPEWGAWEAVGGTLCPEIAFVEDGEVAFAPLSSLAPLPGRRRPK